MFTRRTSSFATIALVAMIAVGCAGAVPSTAPSQAAATTVAPTVAATGTVAPTAAETPTQAATDAPTEAPTEAPSESPSEAPSEEPSASPAAILPTSPTTYAELDQALAGEFKGKTVSIQAQWVGAEGQHFADAVAAFETATGIDILIDSVGSGHEVVLRTRIEGGAPPDLAQIAQPAAMAGYARSGKLIDISKFMVNDRFKKDYAALLDLVTVNDSVYGVPYKVDVKSTVWYPRKAFEAAGYTVPKTWDELKALSDKIVADGNGNPWCISIEHGAATGWVGTDWVEDVLLRTAPRETYQKWINHEIPFTDPAVKKAFDTVAEIFFTPNYAYGGNTYINSTWVGQTMDPAFEEKPGCWMHKQALWYSDFFPPRDSEEPKPQPGEDVGVFYLPPIDPQYGSPVLGSGDVIMVLADRPEVRAVAEFFATPESLATWIQSAGVTSANASTPTSWYEGNYKAGVAAEIIGNGTTFGFDASDLMPAEVGQGTFWNGMVQWISAGGANTDEVLKTIEESWPAKAGE